MTDCTERHLPAHDSVAAGEGQEGIPKASTA
jgi:hypothetical protein